jgi:NAD(P)H-dependent FMN reductase
MGVSGSLKNAIDWTVSSADLSRKPTGLITASSVGEKGHASLLGMLQIIEAKMTEQTQLHIPFVKTKIASDGTIKDPSTEELVKCFAAGIMELVNA